MNIARKIALNLGRRALSVLGPLSYVRLFFTFIGCFPAILRARDLKPLDRAMGKRPLTVRMNENIFIIDCPYIDQHVREETFTFGLVRELYIRNCYLRHGISQAAAKARIILDLGANRGLFSLMMARQAELLIAVEANHLYKEVIVHNMAVNGFTNYRIETAIVGAGGLIETAIARRGGETFSSNRLTVLDIMQKYDIQNVDLLKMDIEGAEFELFRAPQWLSRISALCMEVHTEFGDPQEILTALDKHAFDYAVTDHVYHPVKELKRAVYIYAWKRTK